MVLTLLREFTVFVSCQCWIRCQTPVTKTPYSVQTRPPRTTIPRTHLHCHVHRQQVTNYTHLDSITLTQNCPYCWEVTLRLCLKLRIGYYSYIDLGGKVVSCMQYMKNKTFAVHDSHPYSGENFQYTVRAQFVG